MEECFLLNGKLIDFNLENQFSHIIVIVSVLADESEIVFKVDSRVDGLLSL